MGEGGETAKNVILGISSGFSKKNQRDFLCKATSLQGNQARSHPWHVIGWKDVVPPFRTRTRCVPIPMSRSKDGRVRIEGDILKGHVGRCAPHFLIFLLFTLVRFILVTFLLRVASTREDPGSPRHQRYNLSCEKHEPFLGASRVRRLVAESCVYDESGHRGLRRSGLLDRSLSLHRDVPPLHHSLPRGREQCRPRRWKTSGLTVTSRNHTSRRKGGKSW